MECQLYACHGAKNYGNLTTHGGVAAGRNTEKERTSFVGVAGFALTDQGFSVLTMLTCGANSLLLGELSYALSVVSVASPY